MFVQVLSFLSPFVDDDTMANGDDQYNADYATGDDTVAASDGLWGIFSQKDERTCRVYDGDDSFTALVQIILALFALGSLYLKRMKEVPRRTMKTWALDVGKQGIGASYAHVCNMVRLATYPCALANAVIPFVSLFSSVYLISFPLCTFAPEFMLPLAFCRLSQQFCRSSSTAKRSWRTSALGMD